MGANFVGGAISEELILLVWQKTMQEGLSPLPPCYSPGEMVMKETSTEDRDTLLLSFFIGNSILYNFYLKYFLIHAILIAAFSLKDCLLFYYKI